MISLISNMFNLNFEKMKKTLVGLAIVAMCFSCTDKKEPIVPEIPVKKLKANFSYSPSINIKVGDTVTFINSSENATKYVWDFGDGNVYNSQSPKFVFKSAKDFIVKLKAFDATSSSEMTDTITVLAAKVNTVPKVFNKDLLYNKTWALRTVTDTANNTITQVPGPDLNYLELSFYTSGTYYYSYRSGRNYKSASSYWTLTNNTFSFTITGYQGQPTLVELTNNSMKLKIDMFLLTFTTYYY